MQTVEAGTVANIIVNVVDANGDHVAATITTADVRLQKGNAADTTWDSVTPTSVDTITTGVYRVNFTGISPALALTHNDDGVRCKVNGTIAGVAWTEYHIPLRVVMGNTATTRLSLSAAQIIPGACEGTPSTTVIQTDLAETTDNHYHGRIFILTSGNGAGQATDITAYTGSTGTVTVTALATAPLASDTFVIV